MLAAGRRAARRSCRARCLAAAAVRTAASPHAAQRARSSAARASSSITGPTSVAGSSGSPIAQRLHRALQHRAALGRRCRPAGTAAAAPNSAGRPNRTRRPSRRVDHLLGQRGVSTIIAFMPPVSAISGTIGAVARGERAVDRLRGLGAAGEGDAGDARIVHERLRRPCAVARQQLQRRCAARRPRAAARRRARRSAASARRAWRHRIAGGERRGDLAREDRQREIPRRDAANTPRPPSVQVLRSPVGPGSSRGAAKSRAPAARTSGSKSAASRTSAMPSDRVLPPSRASSATAIRRAIASMRSAARSSTAARCAPPARPTSRQPRAQRGRAARVDPRMAPASIDRRRPACGDRRGLPDLRRAPPARAAVSARGSIASTSSGAQLRAIGKIDARRNSRDPDRDRAAEECADCGWRRARAAAPPDRR